MTRFNVFFHMNNSIRKGTIEYIQYNTMFNHSHVGKEM